MANKFFEDPSPVVSTSRWMAEDFDDHGTCPAQSLEIESRTSVGEVFPDGKGLGRCVHGAEPASCKRAMLSDLRCIALVASIFQEQPAAVAVVVD